jgi:hypothetical protein
MACSGFLSWRRETGSGLLTDQNWWKTETFEHYANEQRQDDLSQTQKLIDEKWDPWGLLLPELTEPWRRPRLPEQKEKPNKKKGPAGAPGGRENQAIWQWQEHLRSISKKWQNEQHTGYKRNDLSIEIEVILQLIHGGHHPPSLI